MSCSRVAPFWRFVLRLTHTLAAVVVCLAILGSSATVEAIHAPTVGSGPIDSSTDGYRIKNYLFGLSSCYGNGTTEIIVQWQALLFSDHKDLRICLKGLAPSRPNPRYRRCGTEEEVDYGRAYDGCAVANPVHIEPPVSLVDSSWGRLKGGYW